MHLAGGFETNGYYLDAHVGPIDPELLELAATVIPRLPRVRAVIYEAVPISLAAQGVAGLRDVLTSMHRIADLPEVAAVPISAGRVQISAADNLASTADREAELLAYTTRASDDLAIADPGADLMRALTDQSRLSLLVRHHESTLGLLLTALGPARTEAVLTEFLAATPASAWRAEQSLTFTHWLKTRPELLPLLNRQM